MLIFLPLPLQKTGLSAHNNGKNATFGFNFHPTISFQSSTMPSHVFKISEYNHKTDHRLLEAYKPEAATNYYEELQAAAALAPNYQLTYSRFNKVFQKCLEQKTNATRLNLIGTFAKTDYLLKEHGAPTALVNATNDTRVRLKRRGELTDEELKRHRLIDLKNLCEFIACVYQTPVPVRLAALFPTHRPATHTPLLIGQRLRMIVDAWDDDFVYGPCEESTDGERLKVAYAHGNKYYDFDWSYLKDMFHKGAQLNLIRPRQDGNTLYPELIIFEPDYLIDISSIAHCFTNYAESPLVSLIDRLKPAQNSEAMVLGNLAGQLLDESIHHLPGTHGYGQSVADFFKNNAISLLTAGIGPDFHKEAQRQKHNIAQALHTTLPKALRRFSSKEGIVEPSFFSELLGMQGRMDYLQLDYKVLLEQKSGKGDYPYDHFVKPRHREEHYIQLLLYMALIRYNFRDTYEKNGRELHAFLLYSKYSDSLLGMAFAPELIFRAIKIRNGLASAELLYTRPHGYRLLETLTPEQLNLKHVDNNLWNDYQYRQIADVLAPIHAATDLEKAYYFRFLTFISNEHMLSKLGNKTKENSGFAAKWHDSLEEKLLAGNIYDRLTLVSPDSQTTGRISQVVLRFAETADNDMSNFRTGDIVILYPYDRDKEPDARQTMVFRCTIEDLRIDSITLRLRAAQADGRIFAKEKGRLWAIEHDFIESSYNSLYKGMHAFLSAPRERRDLLLLQREPQSDTTISLKGNYGAFNELSLRVKQARDLFLIIGPPGTGKTSFGMLNTVKEELLESESTILLMSYTNRAVDEICGKLYEEGIDFIRIGGSLTCADTYRDKLLTARVEVSSNINELKAEFTAARVVVGTTTALNANLQLFKLKQFSLAVVDEASQILEPHLIGLLSAHHNGVPAIKKVVFIGDHKQLTAVVQQTPEVSRVQDAALKDILLTDCRQSLFERLLRKYGNDPRLTYMLSRQGRMHHDIALFPNYAFYNNRLEIVPLPHQNATLPAKGNDDNGIANLLRTRRIAFIATEPPQESSSDKVNQNEADVIAATVVKIYEIEKEGFNVAETVGVIVPYRNQIATIRNTIDRYGIVPLHDITIDTVERYQGSQRKYIIYGFTIQKYYQLNFLTNNVFEDIDGSLVDRKLNVAMTRAEEHLIMVGWPELLSNNLIFHKLLAFVKSKHGYFRIGKEDYVAGRFDVPTYESTDLDTGLAAFSTSQNFDAAFEKHVLRPMKAASGDGWPKRMWGHDRAVCLNGIGYGRADFSHRAHMAADGYLSPEQQVLTYCHYFMRQNYSAGRAVYGHCEAWLKPLIRSVDGRVQMIDMGCGPATCGIAFAELFLDEAPGMVYTGIDTSEEMLKMGERFLDSIFHNRLHRQMTASFTALNDRFWEGCSELPSLVIINFSRFFPYVSAQFAERLARQVCHVIERYPLNRYVLIVEHAEGEDRLNAYNVFKQVIGPSVSLPRHGRSTLTYQQNATTHALPFSYDIFTND